MKVFLVVGLLVAVGVTWGGRSAEGGGGLGEQPSGGGVGEQRTAEGGGELGEQPPRAAAAQGEGEVVYRRLPMVFEANEGQVAGDTRGEVRYLARGHGYQVWLTASGEVVLGLADSAGEESRRRGAAPDEGVLRWRLTESNRQAEVAGMDRLPGQSNYLMGNDPARWRTGIAQYGRIEYREVYPGVTQVWYGTQQSLEYDFIVAPGADPGRIGVTIEGATSMEVDGRGDLLLTVGGRRVVQRRPEIYQPESNAELQRTVRQKGGGTGGRRPVAGRYVIGAGGRIGFEIDDYDHSKPLVIDPVIDYSTFVGGVGSDEGLAIAIDGQQNVYVTGTTYSNNFNVLAPLQTSNRGGKYDAFVTKIDSTGASIVYSTYLGGSGEDEGRGIAVDAGGRVWIAGITNSADFNVRNALQARQGGATEDAFIAKIDENGSALLFSTWLGGSDIDQAFAITLDTAGNAFVAGSTNSADFPTKGGFQVARRGGYDVFVARVRADGGELGYSTLLGGSGFDEAYAVAVDSQGGVWVTGVTESGDFPIAPVIGVLQGRPGGSGDLFVSRIDPTGAALRYSTYFGGSAGDFAYGIDLDPGGDIYLTGHTFSADFPVRSDSGAPVQQTSRGGAEAFITRIAAGGSRLVYSTYLGGSAGDFGRGIAVDGNGFAVVVGRTSSVDFNTFNPLQATNRGDFDAFVARVAPAGDRLIYSTYLGGNGQDLAQAVAVDSLGNAFVTGDTFSTNFNTRNPLQAANRGGFDAFVARLNASGTALEYSTYLGGSGEDLGQGIAIDSAGSAYITGYTSSSDFPTRNAIQSNSRGGLEVFVTKIFADASAIAFNTYIGGNGSDTGAAVAVDQGGSCYVVGTTASTNFPVRNALQGSNRGGFDAFLLKLNATGSNLVFSTYLGGSSGDLGRGLAIDTAGSIQIVGGTFSTDFPVVSPFQSAARGGGDAFVARVNPTATALVYSSYLGGSGLDEATGVVLDASGNACIVGTTGSADFSVRDPLFPTIQGQQDAFVSKVAANGGGLLFSTWLGGGRNDVGNAIAIDRLGNLYVAGATASTDFPRQNALQPGYGGGDFDAFLAKLGPAGTTLLFSTCIGGSATDVANGVGVDAQGTAYLTGLTSSANFPVKNSLQAQNRGGNDAFLSRLSASGTDLIFSSYLGGAADDRGAGVAVDSTGVAYVVGATASSDFNIQFPLVAYGGGTDVFVARVVSEAALTISPRALEVQTGKTATLTVTLNVAATSPVAIALSSSNPALVTVPGSVTVPTGATTATVTVTGKAIGGPVTITALLPDNVGGTTATAAVTVVPASRELSIPAARVAAGGLLTVPVLLTAQGNENRVAFSLEIDPTVLVAPRFTPGDDVANATVETSTLQEAQGRYGFTIYLPQGQTFDAGSRELLIFQAVVVGGAGVSSTRVLFGDQPTVRRVSDLAGSAVTSGYVAGEVAISLGYEGDVSPRPNGSNGTVTTADWTQAGRFAAGLDTPTAGEFQRADTAPRATFGGGGLGMADWVQTGRYAAGLDPIVPAGGPSGAIPGPEIDDFGIRRSADLAQVRALRVAEVFAARGQTVSLTVEVTAVGGENAFGFSLAFDASQLQFTAAAAGADLSAATVNVNSLSASQGRLGLAIALPPGQSLSGGTKRLATVTFAVSPGGTSGGVGSLPVAFADQPIAREVVNLTADALDTSWTAGAVIIPRTLTSVSSASYRAEQFAPESILSAFGTGLSTLTQGVASTPLPTELAGVSIRVRDSAGGERPAPLFFVSPTQVNYLLPAGTATGNASVILLGAGGIYSVGRILVAPIAPALFTANATGEGLAAANAIRVRTDGTQIVEPIGAFSQQSSRFLPVPIDLGPAGEQVFLVLYGTGLRGRDSLNTVSCRVGGRNAVVTFAGAQGGFVGLDQANVLLPRDLAGSGEVEVLLTIDGRNANPVRIAVK